MIDRKLSRRKGFSLSVGVGVIVATVMVTFVLVLGMQSMGSFGQKIGVGNDESSFKDVVGNVRSACQQETGNIPMEDFELTNTGSLEAFSPDDNNNGGLRITFSNDNTLERKIQKCSVRVTDAKNGDSSIESGSWKLNIHCTNCGNDDSSGGSSSPDTPIIEVEGVEPESSNNPDDSSGGED